MTAVSVRIRFRHGLRARHAALIEVLSLTASATTSERPYPVCLGWMERLGSARICSPAAGYVLRLTGKRKADSMFKRGWESAQATIVASKDIKDVGTGGTTAISEYVADIQPDSGAPLFRATFKSGWSLHTIYSPNIGAVVRVRFDPKSHEVKFDTSDPTLRHGAGNKAEADRFEAARNATPTSTAESTKEAASGAAGRAHGMHETLQALQAAIAKRKATEDALKRAKDSGDPGEATRLETEVQASSAEFERLNAVVAYGS
jgi:hypothetical protein